MLIEFVEEERAYRRYVEEVFAPELLSPEDCEAFDRLADDPLDKPAEG